MIGEVTKNNRHAIARIVASDAVEALIQLASSYPKQAKDLIGITNAVLNQRLIRRLCDKCKQPFQPALSYYRSWVFHKAASTSFISPSFHLLPINESMPKGIPSRSRFADNAEDGGTSDELPSSNFSS